MGIVGLLLLLCGREFALIEGVALAVDCVLHGLRLGRSKARFALYNVREGVEEKGDLLHYPAAFFPLGFGVEQLAFGQLIKAALP
jgi:hypothetical protein